MSQHLFRKLQNELDKEVYTRSKIVRFSINATNKYKVYTIPKRQSGRRVIAHPSRELKCYQRALLRVLSSSLVNHPCSIAYTKGIGIKENANIHAKNTYLLKMDFNDFFNSITPDIFFSQHSEFSKNLSKPEIELLKNILFWNKGNLLNKSLVLSVGAPSSPAVSNSTMFNFDSLVSNLCNSKDIRFTRYADDLTFSTNKKEVLFSIPNMIKNILEDLFDNKITINESKTVFSSKKHNRHITGITINNEGYISIGRDRKRLISALVHKFKLRKLNKDDCMFLQGYIAFCKNIDPNFLNRLEIKYGSETLNRIIKGKFYERL